MSVHTDRSSPYTYAPVRRQLFSNVRLGRGTYSSGEESRLMESLPEGLRARLLFSETTSSRSSDQRVPADIFNVQLERLRLQAGTPLNNEDQVESKLQEPELKVDHEMPFLKTEENNKKSKLSRLRKEADDYLTQTEWMISSPRCTVDTLKKF